MKKIKLKDSMTFPKMKCNCVTKCKVCKCVYILQLCKICKCVNIFLKYIYTHSIDIYPKPYIHIHWIFTYQGRASAKGVMLRALVTKAIGLIPNPTNNITPMWLAFPWHENWQMFNLPWWRHLIGLWGVSKGSNKIMVWYIE